MFKPTGTIKTVLKSATALVVCLGLAAQLAPTPAQAGKKEAAILFGAIVATGIIAHAAHQQQQQQQQYRPKPRPQRYTKPQRVRRPVAKVNYNHAENVKIQTALNTLGYNAGAVDGVIGNGTRSAISTFQIDIDESATGVLTAEQKIILFDRAEREEAGVDVDDEPTFDQAEVGNDVAEVQTALNELGYEAGPADGVIGANTVEAIMEFQADYDLPETGVLTDEERDMLFAEVAEVEEDDDEDDTEDLAEFDEDEDFADEEVEGDV
jgi:peptidoglycan hydrolase-like protein with peptidoglycan-binding domain